MSDGDIRATFSKFDSNFDRRLDHRELRLALKALGLNLDTGQAQSVLQKYDTNRNGLIELDEFQRPVRRHPRPTRVGCGLTCNT